MSSSSHVEARSLTALNHIAANPPQYPVNPTEQTRESLILYISRVFGTRDVILSTFKPQRKTVTADDVANSLYYVHLDHPDDVLLVPPKPVREEDNPRSSCESSRSTTRIQRKPLPANARVGIKNQGSELSERPFAPSLVAHDSFGSQRSEGVRFLDAPTNVDGARPGPPSPHISIASPTSPASSHPSGPRPMNIPGAARPEVPPPLYPSREMMGPLSDSPGRTSMLSTSAGSRLSPPQDAPPLPDRHYSTKPFSLTLIRRDPMSGNQWNVGKVYSYQREDVNGRPQSPTNDHGVLSYPISINIETSGYAKFRGMPSKASMEAKRASAASLPQSISNLTMEGGFFRQVAMSYTKSMRAGIREKMHRRSESESRRPWHRRQASTGSASSAESMGGSPPSPTILMHPAPGFKPFGYMFKSPWDGRCEFRTGATGSSIKCHHVLPEAVATGDPDPMKQVFGPGAAQVSELRFNLPSVDLFGKGKRGKIAKDVHGHLSKFLKQPGDSDFEDDNDWEGMDLTLGREIAGGGVKGNRSKLGKLIIHDEGIKMLDLVVAANIGLWWSAWEKRS